jgi:hypothetical protein
MKQGQTRARLCASNGMRQDGTDGWRSLTKGTHTRSPGTAAVPYHHSHLPCAPNTTRRRWRCVHSLSSLRSLPPPIRTRRVLRLPLPDALAPSIRSPSLGAHTIARLLRTAPLSVFIYCHRALSFGSAPSAARRTPALRCSDTNCSTSAFASCARPPTRTREPRPHDRTPTLDRTSSPVFL